MPPKMQHEKLYNLRSKAYFNWLLFVFKQSTILCEHFSKRRNLIAQNFLDFEYKNYNCTISGPI
jgi:hypothetical protein